MKQEEKELLIKYLCEMLYHNVKVEYGRIHEGKDLGETQDFLTGRMIDSYKNNIMIGFTEVYSITPYLRPMSSMTEEEMEELRELCGGIVWTKDILHDEVLNIYYRHDALDWLLKHHFDTRGLIEMGLALEAPEGMYDFK